MKTSPNTPRKTSFVLKKVGRVLFEPTYTAFSKTKAPKKSFRRTGSTKPKAKSKRKVGVWAEFGIKRPVWVRYSGYAGVLWWLVSQIVRIEEFEQYGGACVDGCGATITNWREADCGHFRSSVYLSTRFLRRNLGLQSKRCNSPWGGNGNQYGFGKTIDQRYGEGAAQEIIELSKMTGKSFSKEWYREQITAAQAKLKELSPTE